MEPINAESIEMADLAGTNAESGTNQQTAGKNENVEADGHQGEAGNSGEQRVPLRQRVQNILCCCKGSAEEQIAQNQNEQQGEAGNSGEQIVPLAQNEQQIETHFQVVVPFYNALQDIEGRMGHLINRATEEQRYWHSIMVQFFAIFVTIITVVFALVIFMLPTIEMKNATKHD